MTSTYWDALRLYTGDNWPVVDLPEFAEHGLVSSFFLHGIHPGSGSLIPEGPAVVFSAGTHPKYQLWFVRFDLPTAVTAVAEANSTPPRDFGLAQNAPNPFNKGTAIDFWLADCRRGRSSDVQSRRPAGCAPGVGTLSGGAQRGDLERIGSEGPALGCRLIFLPSALRRSGGGSQISAAALRIF